VEWEAGMDAGVRRKMTQALAWSGAQSKKGLLLFS